MIDICIVTNPSSAATDFYRSTSPLRYIQQATGGAIKINPVEPSDLKWHTLENSDIVFFSRPNGSLLQDIIVEAKDMGKTVWVDYDDLLDGLSDYNPAKVHFNKPEIIKSVQTILKIADVITVSTEYLKDAYKKQTDKKIKVIKNAFDNHRFKFQPIKKIHTPIRMHWRGSATHLGDLMTVKHTFDYMIDSKKWDVNFHGLQDWMLATFDVHTQPQMKGKREYKVHGWENRLFRYFRTFQQCHPDWVIFPLIDDPFNQSKSNISAIEALLAGAAVLAPSGFPEFLMPGIVNYENEDHLMSLLKSIESGDEEYNKQELVMNGRNWLSNFLTVDQENEKRMEVISSLTGVQFRKKQKV